MRYSQSMQTPQHEEDQSSHIKHKINTTSYNIILPHPPTISMPYGD